MAGLLFSDCHDNAISMDAPGAAGSGKRREVVVSGRRVKTIDMHCHCIIPDAMALMGGVTEGMRRAATASKRWGRIALARWMRRASTSR
jgi:hypothetical protein